MNERIEKLAVEARQYAFAKVELTQDPTEWSTKYYNEMFEQKFAELIVRDCISSIELYKNNSVTKEIAAEGVYSYESGCVAGMDESILIIKKHFGVE